MIEAEVRGMPSLAEAHSQEMRVALEAGREKETDFPLEPAGLLTLDFSPL